MNLIERDDPRVRLNVDAIERRAYARAACVALPARRDRRWAGRPGRGRLHAAELLADGNLIYTGQNDRAMDYFHNVITTQSNHLGLFAEMFDPVTQRQLGNFPKPTRT